MDSWYILAIAILYPKPVTPEQAYRLYCNGTVYKPCKVQKCEQKLKELLSAGRTIREAAKALKINYNTVQRYIADNKFCEHNGLAPRKRGPKKCTN